EAEVDFGLQVAAADRLGASAPAAAAVEDAAEDVAEVGAEAARLRAAAPEGIAAAERVAARAESAEGRTRVVLLALLRVGEDVVRGRDLLELFLGLFVAGVAVRVVFARQLAVRLLDLVLARVLADAEGLVELVCHFSSSVFPRRP